MESSKLIACECIHEILKAFKGLIFLGGPQCSLHFNIAYNCTQTMPIRVVLDVSYGLNIVEFLAKEFIS